MLSINGVADPVAAAAGASLNCSQPQKDSVVISSYLDLSSWPTIGKELDKELFPRKIHGKEQQ